jgi:hypothetical protein
MTSNPFQFGAANDLSPEEVLDYYIEDFNFSRFIQSKRNVFILGERGSGKTMTLLYHSLAAQRRKAARQDEAHSLDRVGVYVPCNTPLTHRTEHELLADFKAGVLSEHFLVLAVAHHLALTLEENADVTGGTETAGLGAELGDALGREMPDGETLFRRVLAFTVKEIRETQRLINRSDSDTFYDQALSFSTLLMPLLDVFRRVPELATSHYLLMIDDAHDLNDHQVQALNSWIAYRDHSLFSFKVATAKVSPPSRITASGGSILEGHDFTVVDMEKPLQNEQSDFGQLAARIVSRRLKRIGYEGSPEDFFPVHPAVERDLSRAKEVARKEALERYGPEEAKKVSDYVYKYHRAIYFRSREAKANLPVYSGFRMIMYLSTGVVRNLLEPCFWMYDKAVSSTPEGVAREPVASISPSIQNEILMDLSQRMWDRLKEGLDRIVAGCSREDARSLERLFEQLAQLFRARLLGEGSEPRALSFSVSGGRDEADVAELERLLRIARKATFLYVRSGAAKDAGGREAYYVPNRLLWPVRGLDPQGQHARVSLRAARLMGAARGSATLAEGRGAADEGQGVLFDESS